MKCPDSRHETMKPELVIMRPLPSRVTMSDGLPVSPWVSHTIINMDHILHGARLWVRAVTGGPRPFPFVVL